MDRVQRGGGYHGGRAVRVQGGGQDQGDDHPNQREDHRKRGGRPWLGADHPLPQRVQEPPDLCSRGGGRHHRSGGGGRGDEPRERHVLHRDDHHPRQQHQPPVPAVHGRGQSHDNICQLPVFCVNFYHFRIMSFPRGQALLSTSPSLPRRPLYSPQPRPLGLQRLHHFLRLQETPRI